MAPMIWNKRHAYPHDAVYIGRPSKWGNPFHIGRDGNRHVVIEKYRHWLLADPERIAAVKRELRGKHLVCWCAPFACHGDVLLEVANEEEVEKEA